MRLLALDTQLVIRTQCRRMLSATAEATGCRIVVPTTAARMAALTYRFTVAKYLRRRTIRELAARGEPTTDKAIASKIAPLVDHATTGFATWLENEGQRNDSVIEVATPSRSTGELAVELFASGIIRDPSDTRWNIGEDPYVVAEALTSGAHWIASENLVRVSRKEMELWLNDEQAEGRYSHVPRPFILSPDEAIDTMLDQADPERSPVANATGTRGERVRATTLIAQAVTAPRRNFPVNERLAILDRFGNDLVADGLIDTGKRILRETEGMQLALEHQGPAAVNHLLGTMTAILPTTTVEHTRSAEDRRLELEGTRPSPGGSDRTPGPTTGEHGGHDR